MSKCKCSRCEYYDKLNGKFCRVCGKDLRYDHTQRAKINQTYMTDEKFCDNCGKNRHIGNC